MLDQEMSMGMKYHLLIDQPSRKMIMKIICIFVVTFWKKFTSSYTVAPMEKSKKKNSTICKIMINWWDFEGIKENFIPLSEDLMG